MTPEQAAENFLTTVYGSTPFIPKNLKAKAEVIEYLTKLRKATADMIYYICDKETCPESAFSMLSTVSNEMRFTEAAISKRYYTKSEITDLPNAD